MSPVTSRRAGRLDPAGILQALLAAVEDRDHWGVRVISGSEETEPQRGSVRNALMWASIGQGVFFVSQFANSILLAHLLSPREMGVFAVGAATVALVSALQSLGLNNYLIRAERLDKSELSTVFTVNLVLSLLVAVGIVALGVLSEHLFKEPGTVKVMLWMATTPVLAAIGLVPSSLMQRENNFRMLSMLKIASTLIGNILTAVLALVGFSFMSLAYGWVTTCAVTAFGACVLAPQHVHLRIGVRDWRKVSAFGMSMILVNGVTQAQRQILNLVLGKFQGLEAVGLFSRANNLFSLLSENTQTVAMRVFLVDFADASRRGLDLRDRYRRVIELMTALLWPVFAGLAVLSAPCIRLLYGPMWEMLAIPLSLLCISGLLWISIAMAWELFVVANETGKQARIEINRATFGSVLFVIGCQFSLNVAVATRIAEGVYSIFLYRPHIVRITGCTSKDLGPVFLRSGVLTLLAVAPATAVMTTYRWSAKVPLMVVAASISVGVLLWLAALVVQHHPLLDQFKAIVQKRRSARSRPAEKDALAMAEIGELPSESPAPQI